MIGKREKRRFACRQPLAVSAAALAALVTAAGFAAGAAATNESYNCESVPGRKPASVPPAT